MYHSAQTAIDNARSLLSTSERLLDALPETMQEFQPIIELAVLLHQVQRLLAEPVAETALG